jgi:polycomb protein EED
MAAQKTSKPAFRLPQLKYRYKTTPEPDRFHMYDVKFYPYAAKPNEQPVFAMVSPKKVYIARLGTGNEPPVTMLHVLVDLQEQDDQQSPGLNSCAWCFINQHEPLLAVAGGSGQLKLIDASKGAILTTLIGHGHGTINDIAVHPLYPWIVATASMDKSLRIWDIRRHANRHQSSTIIICGQASGHCEGVLTVSWHSTGRYLVTGGHDQRVCVWTVPDLDDRSSFWHKISPKNKDRRTAQECLTIHYPHFISSTVHSNFVDCARFYGDLIISKAAVEEKIVLWKITGFDSGVEPPDQSTAPKVEEYLDTRNGFIRVARKGPDDDIPVVEVSEEHTDAPLFERLLELDAPRAEPFFMRFGLLAPSPDHPDIHSVIAFGNANSEVRFWDLERYLVGHAGTLKESKALQNPPKKPKGIAQRVKPQDRNRSTTSNVTVHGLRDLESPVSSTSARSSTALQRQSSTDATSEASDVLTTPLSGLANRERYPIHDPHLQLKAHHKISLVDLQVKNGVFTTRGADWSPCGKWCIVVGESQMELPNGSISGAGGFAVLYRDLSATT